jgi:hypothetical protein
VGYQLALKSALARAKAKLASQIGFLARAKKQIDPSKKYGGGGASEYITMRGSLPGTILQQPSSLLATFIKDVF